MEEESSEEIDDVSKDADYIDGVHQLTAEWIEQVKQCYESEFEKLKEKLLPSQQTRDQYIHTVRRIFGNVKMVKGKPSYSNFQKLLIQYHRNQCTVAKRKSRETNSAVIKPSKPQRSKSPPKKSISLHIKYLDPVSYKLATQPGYIDMKDDVVVAQSISQGLDSNVKTQYVERDIKNFISELYSMQAPQAINAIKDTQLVPEYAVFKATGLAYDAFTIDDPVSCQIWFSDFIQPVLKGNYFHSNLTLSTTQDLQKIAKIITKIRALDTVIDESDSLKVCQILHKAGEYADFIRKSLAQSKKLNNKFWIQVIQLFFGYNHKQHSIIDIILNNKESLFTDALILFKEQKILKQDLLVALSKFQALTFEELADFYKFSINEQFYTLTSLLKTTINIISVHSVKIESQQEIDTMKKILIDKPLDTWHLYYDQIHSSVGDIDDDYALQIVKETFNSVCTINKLDPLSKVYREILEEQWKVTFEVLKEKQILQKAWQKELIYHLLDLILNRDQKFIVVQLDTGHGKSIICQLLATMLYYVADTNSIVTCANEFLAYYSEFTYSTVEQQSYIQYLSLNKLLQTDVQFQYVITDEHDIMAGLNSFHVIESSNGQHITGKYLPSIYSQSKALIAFSGTVSSATRQQLNWFNPKAIFVQIPSLKLEKQKNVLKNFIHIYDGLSIYDKVTETLKQEKESSNFIVIFDNTDQVREFQRTKAKNLEQRNLFVFDDFKDTQNFALYQKNLKDLSTLDFIVLTVKDGCRGVDFKGKSPAHVIIACQIDNYSELIQALGRGSRDLRNISTGTLISKKNYENGLNAISFLQNQDQLKGKQALVNDLVGRIVHNKRCSIVKLKSQDIKEIKRDHKKGLQELKANNEQGALELIMFRTHVKEGWSFTEGDEPLLWTFIKSRFDDANEMPEEAAQFNQVTYLKKLKSK